MAEWTDELREAVVEAYVEQNPTAETTMDCLEKVATEFDVTVNSARTIINKAGKYIKKAPATATTTSASTRVSKADAQQTLTDLIESLGKDADDSIINKLTGKAALYFVEVFKKD